MPEKVAVVGAGVAGLSAAYHLRNDFKVTLYESDTRAGGHANTIEVVEHGQEIGLDTAFVVFNEPYYPKLTRFFKDLGVPTLPHNGGFLFCDFDRGTDFTSEELELPEDEVRRSFSQNFQLIWREAERFYKESRKDFVRGRANVPLGDYLKREGYSEEFKWGFMVLVCSAAWSVPAEQIWEFPASTVIAFFWGHGQSGIGGRSVEWRTVDGGSITYVRRVLDELHKANVETLFGSTVTGIRADDDGAIVATPDGAERFDYVVVATHADQARQLLERPEGSQKFLEKIDYNPTKVVLHTDSRVLPADRERWHSWNYGKITSSGQVDSYVVYHLNQMHGLSAETDYFVTLDCPVGIRDDRVIQEFEYYHPLLTCEAREVQSEIYSINEVNRVKFAGSYFHSRQLGRDITLNHEAAFDSGMCAAESILRDAWPGS